MFLIVEQKNRQTTPAIRPSTIAPIGPAKPAAGVTATRPAMQPESDAEQRRLTLHDPFDEHPGQRRRRGGDERVDHGERRAAGGFEVGAGVEAEPADPQQRRRRSWS